jgi:hypothetical protein
MPVTAGERDPEVRCEHHESSPGAIKVIPTCKTRDGKALPLSDCCMDAEGQQIPNCTMKLQPPGE